MYASLCCSTEHVLTSTQAQLPGIDEFFTRLESVPALTAPWLMMEAKAPQLVPTHVKQVMTSAPKDMKVAKEARSQGRSTAKAKKRAQPRITVISSREGGTGLGGADLVQPKRATRRSHRINAHGS